MATTATAATRAPRGTKTLTQAFFEAADGIPEPQRAAVVKAALAAIRGHLKDAREKAKISKAKAKAAAGKSPSARRPKAAAAATGKPRAVPSNGKAARAKPGPKPSVKPGRRAAKPAPEASGATAA